MNYRVTIRFVVLCFVAASLAGFVSGQDKYKTADEAYSVGAVHHNAKNYAASREPFEAALRLAPDDKFRIKVYEGLMQAYRELPEIDKMQEACEFILTHSDQDAKRSLTRRSLISFIFQRGKIDELIKQNEERLKKDKDDQLAIYLLTEVYSKVKQNPQRAAELLARLSALEKKAGKPADASRTASLAAQYVKAGKFKEGAELYEEIAPQSGSLAAWHWKEAATAWLKANNKEKSLAAAKMADKADPEKRNDQLAHFWHRQLGETYLQCGDPKSAIPHLEQALAKTNIEGYKKDCETLLEQARKAVRKLPGT